MRYLITFSYDGANYLGYQVQKQARTIQGEIEEKLTMINGNIPVRIHASGRTDAGVHALNQKAHFDLQKDISVGRIKESLNKMLPLDIYIKNVEKVSAHFHARYNVKKKEYIYIINLGEYNPIERNYVHQYNKSLNIDLMLEASRYLIGTHSFESFTKTEGMDKCWVRTIEQINITEKNQKLIISFIGDGFLRYMVRNMVGTLIEVGEEKTTPNSIVEILQKKDRTCAGKTASSCGLYLKDVFY